MSKLTVLALCAVASVVPMRSVAAQVAGGTTVGVTTQEMKTVVRGWSAQKKLIDKPVYNDANEKVGEVEDVIVAPDGKVSWAILGVGGFLGVAEKLVVVPMTQLKLTGDRFVLRGATKEALKAAPEFKYAEKSS